MEVIDLVKKVHDAAVDETEHLRFDKTHPWHLHLIGLYGTQIELAFTLVLLIENQRYTAVPIVFRSFLEAFVDFCNLAAERSYGNHMQAAYNEQWLKVFRDAESGDNPFLADIGGAENLGSEIDKHSAALKDLANRRFKPLKVIERFKKAGMVKEYHSLYNFMCSHSHNDIRSLISRHMDIGEDDFSVVFYKAEPLSSFVTYCDAVASALIDASQCIHGILGSKKEAHFVELRKEMDRIRSRY